MIGVRVDTNILDAGKWSDKLTSSQLTRNDCQWRSGVQTLYNLRTSIPPKKCTFKGRPCLSVCGKCSDLGSAKHDSMVTHFVEPHGPALKYSITFGELGAGKRDSSELLVA